MSETTVYTDFRLHARHLAETGERSPAEVAVRRDLAAAYQLCALFGWDDLVYTHISARVPGPEHHFLVNPLGLGFDEITASSLIKIDLDGNVIGDSGGYEPNAAGFVIHGAIHVDSENAAASCTCTPRRDGPVDAAGGPAAADAARDAAARPDQLPRLRGHRAVRAASGRGWSRTSATSAAMMLRNHGSLTVGASVAQAFVEMFYLEKAARSQLLAQATGQPLIIPPRETIELTARQWDGMLDAGIEWRALLRQLAGGRARLRPVTSPAGSPLASVRRPRAGVPMTSPPMTFAQRWDTAVRTSGDRPFLVFEGADRSVSQWTYRQFDEAVTRMGATLAAAGVTRGRPSTWCCATAPRSSRSGSPARGRAPGWCRSTRRPPPATSAGSWTGSARRSGSARRAARTSTRRG